MIYYQKRWDGSNTGANQNFKAVPWESIATAVTPNLMIDTWRSPPPDVRGAGIPSSRFE
jgi:hypothetical protein